MPIAKVLFIEDNRVWQEMLRDILETAGYETNHASVLDRAFSLLDSEKKIDVIVFDLNLGLSRNRHSPFAWLDALIQGLKARDILVPPIIIVTGIHLTSMDVRQCFVEYRGIIYDLFLKTEFDERVFLRSVKDAMESGRSRTQSASFWKVLVYLIIMAIIVALVIGILLWSVTQIADPKTQQVFLKIGGTLVVVLVLFVFMVAQSTKLEDILESITKIWRIS